MKKEINLKELINESKKLTEKEKENIKKKEKKKKINEKGQVGRVAKEEILEFNIEEVDNKFIYFIKNKINNEKITNIDVYNAIGREKGYRLISELNKGNLTLKSFYIWVDILDIDFDIVLK